MAHDMSTATTISEYVLRRLFDKYAELVCEAAAEAASNNDNKVELYFGFFSLEIEISNEEVKTRVKYTDKFSKDLAKSIEEERAAFETKLEAAVVRKITEVYKSLC